MEELTVTALGHAGLLVRGPGVRLLADPWMSPEGAFLGAWFPFPDNAHLVGPSLRDVDVVVVSHEHLDHLDLPFLATLPEDVPIVVPRYPSDVLQRRLRAAGRRHVRVLEAWERFDLGGEDWLTVIPESCPMSHDAAVLVRMAGTTVLHTNDARISLAQVRRAMTETGGPIDLMAVQMSGASWHPVCYEYDDAERRAIEELKRVAKFKAVTRLVRMVGPRLVIPYAGPPCFLDDDLFEHNGRLRGPGIFPDGEEAADWLRARLPGQRVDHLLPGDRVEPRTGHVERDAHWDGFSLGASAEDRRDYLRAYAARRAPFVRRAWEANPRPEDDGALGVAFARHFEALGTLSAYFLARIGMVLRFEVLGPGGGVWDVHIGPEGVRVDLEGGSGPAHYRLTMEGRWLRGVVEGRTRWEELLLSLRFSARREPDHYNDYLVGLLKHADLAALRAVEDYERGRDSRETMPLRAGERELTVSRYCPHAGEDLAETGIVVGDRLRCLGHNFEFDLATGECLNARCEPLSVAPGTAADRSPAR